MVPSDTKFDTAFCPDITPREEGAGSHRVTLSQSLESGSSDPLVRKTGRMWAAERAHDFGLVLNNRFLAFASLPVTGKEFKDYNITNSQWICRDLSSFNHQLGRE